MRVRAVYRIRSQLAETVLSSNLSHLFISPSKSNTPSKGAINPAFLIIFASVLASHPNANHVVLQANKDQKLYPSATGP